MDPHQTRLVRLLQNGCEEHDPLLEAILSCVAQHEHRALAGGDSGALAVVATAEADDGASSTADGNGAGGGRRRHALDFAAEESKDMTPLEIATLTQNNKAVELLLRNGAQPDVISGLSCTCLCKVCYTFPGNIAMMRLLLEAGANPDATTNNDTASASCLIISVVKDNVEAVRALLEFGADVSYEWKGANALSMALDFKKLDIVDLLENHEYRRAQDNRWRRFTDRKAIEENKAAQQKALRLQFQLEDERKKMLKRNHNNDPMIAPPPGTGSHHQHQHHPNGGLLLHAPASEGRGTSPVLSAQQLYEIDPTMILALPQHHHQVAQAASLPHQHHQQQQQLPSGGSPGGAAQQRSTSYNPTDEHAERSAALVVATGISADVISSMTTMDWLVPREDVEILEPISSGAHGDVYRGRLISIDELVAVKKFPCNDQKSRDCFRQEVMMLSRFRHENIVMFKGAIVASDLCCILSELCVENLMSRLERGQPISWPTRLRWARDIAKALNYLHTRTPPVVHRDLKSLNVLLDHNGCVKLCDFGMARTREHTYIATQHISGSPSWMAPEVLRGDDFNDKSDVYSFGVILWELLFRRVPWPDKSMAQLVGLVGFAGHRLEIPKTKPEGCPPGYEDLILACWAKPEERPTFRTIRAQLDAILADVD